MKRVFAIFLIALLLCGCSAKETVSFYFLRSDYVYGTEDGVIALEHRDASGSENSLYYLLRLYLDGPLSDTYTSPFPKGTRLISVLKTDNTVYVTLNQEYASLTELDLTLANACLTSTVFSLTDAGQVQIISGDEVYNFDRASFTLYDDTVTNTSQEGTETP